MINRQLSYIARIHTDFSSKFGIPRQSGLADQLKAVIVFEAPYRNVDALRGLEAFSHIWLIWEFSGSLGSNWSPTVRPPRLGGNKRVGVFATRSPFRPNSLGLSVVKIESIELNTPQGAVIHISGADLMDGTPIFDIKPYLPEIECIADAKGGFADEVERELLRVEIPHQWLQLIPADKQEALFQVLALDPRPSYQDNPERIYGVLFAGFDVRFMVDNKQLTVCEVVSVRV